MKEWNREPFSFSSTDGVHEIAATLYLPEQEPVGVIQLVHGMMDHSGRYLELARAMTEAGFAFVGMDGSCRFGGFRLLGGDVRTN